MEQEIAALFEAHCGDPDPFVVSNGYSLETFVKRIDGLQLRSKVWKKRAQDILAKWRQIGDVASTGFDPRNLIAAALEDIKPTTPAKKAELEPEPYVPAPGEIMAMFRANQAKLRAERSKERTE